MKFITFLGKFRFVSLLAGSCDACPFFDLVVVVVVVDGAVVLGVTAGCGVGG